MSGFNLEYAFAYGLKLIRSGSALSSKVVWCLMAMGAGYECSHKATQLVVSFLVGLESGNWWLLAMTAGDGAVRAFWAYQAIRDAAHTAKTIMAHMQR
jgi:hypothetical protein